MSQHIKRLIATLITEQNLASEREQVNALAVELGVSVLDCAAALLNLSQADKAGKDDNLSLTIIPVGLPTVRMVRYRLSVGIKHQITLDLLKQVLVEESGVDVNNIKNVSIRDDYTLLELPDAMPADIFQHLKTVTINQHELDIKRLKARYKKRGGYQRRRFPSNNSNSTELKPGQSADLSK